MDNEFGNELNAPTYVVGREADAFERAAAGDLVTMVDKNRLFHRAINAIADNQPAIDVLRGRLSLNDALRVGLGQPELLDREPVRQVLTAGAVKG